MRHPLLATYALAATVLLWPAPEAAFALNSDAEPHRYAAERRLVALLSAMRPAARRERGKIVALIQSAGRVSPRTAGLVAARRDAQVRWVRRIFGAINRPRLAERIRPRLEAARRKTIAAVFDTGSPEGLQDDRARQKTIDAEVKAAYAVWNDPYGALLAAEATVARVVRDLEELETIMQRLGLLDAEQRLDLKRLAAEVGEDLRRLWTPPDDLAVVSYNRSLRECLRPEEFACVRAVNDYRLMLGRRALEIDLRLVQAARGHSAEMRVRRFFSHTSPTPGRKTPADRARRDGYDGPVAENIAAGPPNGVAAFRAWYGSLGHHRNLLRSHHTLVGVSYAVGSPAGRIWTQLMGGGDGFRTRRHKPPRIDYLYKSLRLKKHDAESHFQLALLCYRYGLRRYQEHECRQTLRYNPDHVQAHWLLGEVLSLDGRWVTAGAKQAP